MRTVFDPRKMESELQREISRADRYKRSVSICVIEATNMRLLRERFGSTLAQRLYDRLGERLAQHSRDIDVIGQYKASGYTMILSEAEPEGAKNAAARLLAIARDAQLDPADRVDGLELHLACGWASAPTDGSQHRSHLRRRQPPHVRPPIPGGVASEVAAQLQPPLRFG